jgi:hypothetical protein
VGEAESAETAGGSHARALLVALAATAIVMAALLWPGGVWERVSGPDLHALFLPKYEAAVRALFREHRLPLWNPYEFCGLPLLALTQGAVLYPPTWLAFGLLPARAALQVFYAFHVALLALGSVLYLRRHGVPAWAAAVVPLATVAGLATAISGSGYDHPSFVASTAWLPWMLLLAERGVDGSARRAVGLLGLVVGSQWLAGYPDFPLDTAIVLGVVALVAHGPRALVVVVLGVGIGMALAAIQLLPLADALAESARSAPSATLAAGRDAFAVASPMGLVHGLVTRQGLAVLALGLVGVLARRRIALAWLAALVWALLPANPPFAWLYLVPPFSGIRFLFGWTGLAPFLLGCLAASGATAIAHRSRLAALVLVMVVTVESMRILVLVPESMPERAHDPALVARRAARLAAIVAERPGERVLSPFDALAGAPLRYGIPTPGGWEPSLAPRRVVRLLQTALIAARGPEAPLEWRRVAPHEGLLALLGVGTIVVPPEVATTFWRAGFRPDGGVPPDDVVMHAWTVPRVRLVHRTEVVDGEDASYQRVLAHPKEAAILAVVETATPPIVKEPPSGEQSTITSEASDRVEIDVTATAPGLLVLGDTYYRGWEATVDDHPAEILPTDHAFRSVAVPTGRHHVVFRYRPTSVRWGATISGGALLLIAVLLAKRA